MGGLFLTCCLVGLKLSRHFTPQLGEIVAWMLAAGLVVGGVLMVVNWLRYPLREMMATRSGRAADARVHTDPRR